MNPPKETHILVVDDTPANLRLLSQMLIQNGYKVRVANNGPLAIDSVRTNPPDLILLDVMMPEMNGYQVCEQIKTDPALRTIPIIFISALDTTEDKVRAFTIGGVDYITKPFHVEEVLARVQTHLSLQFLQKDLQQRVAELDAFSHTVAHDLKNPLTAILGFNGLLKHKYNRMTPEEIEKNLLRIESAGTRMNNIIDELLLLANVSKLEKIDVVPLDMAALIAEVRERMVYEIEQSACQITLPASWPEAIGHAPWIEEIWVNYISNAIKYGGDPPQVELGWDLIPGEKLLLREQTAPSIRFWVHDNGAGLTQEEQNRLFVPFTRIHQAHAQGHGLGLSIVRQIVEKLGGRAGVESTPGSGSRFYFTLPAK